MTTENWISIIALLITGAGILYNSIHSLRKEMYLELEKIEEKSDKRDGEIKELIREMKAELREDMKEIKDDIRRAESFKCAGQKNNE